jgi:hypothetical protein
MLALSAGMDTFDCRGRYLVMLHSVMNKIPI